jgi:hypothetical protein
VVAAERDRWNGSGSGRCRVPAARGTGCRRVVALLCVLLGGCATPPPAPPAPPPTPIEAPVVVPARPICADSTAEIAGLRRDLASRDAELRDLRAQQRDQARALQETTRQATRAKVKLRRLASQADAASYVAEVEVALEVARTLPGAGSRAPLLALAQEILESSAASFAQGDYGAAMDFAARAEELVAIAASAPAGPASGSRATATVSFDETVRLRVRRASHLRRQPRAGAPSIAVLPAGTRLVARAYRDGWLKVETENGRSGWMFQSVVAAP